LEALRASSGTNPIRIGASASTEAIVNFYRAQHRVITWDRADEQWATGNFDYYVLAGSDIPYADLRHLIVVYRDPQLVVAHRGYDSM
jgi:hypothetical protein